VTRLAARIAAGGLLALTTAGIAAAHIPFVEGPGSARRIQAAMNRSADFESVTCRYRAPHVICRGYARWPQSDAYVAVRITVHKTGPKKGYAMVCLIKLGISHREPMTFTR
jgi:hypothetical protein